MRLEASRFIAESYFGFQSENASASLETSRRLFSKHPLRLSAARLAEALQTAAAAAEGTNAPQIEALQRELAAGLLRQCYIQLQLGLNLALYGYGSKTRMLKTLADGHLAGFHVFWLRTYRRDAAFAALLHTMMDALGVARSGKDAVALAEQIVQAVAASPPRHPIVVVVETADGGCMRSNERAWRAMVRLAESAHIRMILTFEHINAHLLANEETWTRLNLAWHDCTTMLPYAEELLPLVASQRGAVDGEARWRGAQHVLGSLTRTARGVFRVLAEHQTQGGGGSSGDLAAPDAGESSGSEEEEEWAPRSPPRSLSLTAWYQRCQEQFLVSNEIAFRTQLTEFLDHELICVADSTAHAGDGFYIPFGPAQIGALAAICAS